eukprot:s3038_g25.t1
MALDRRLKLKMLKPDKTKGEDKMHLAGREALKVKKLLGALRALWRSSSQSHDNRVAVLKSMIQASPARAARNEAEPSPEPAQQPSPEPAPPSSDGESEADSHEEKEEGSSGEEGSGEEGSGEEGSGGEDLSGQEGLAEDAVDSSQATSTQADSVDSLGAETLRLDPEPRPFTPSSVESDRERKREESLEKTLNDIKTELIHELGELGDSEWETYAAYCRRVMGSYGAPSYGA